MALNRFNGGLSRLVEAAKSVDQMSTELLEKKVRIFSSTHLQAISLNFYCGLLIFRLLSIPRQMKYNH